MSANQALVVVGDDGSSQAGGAVQWAARHAAEGGSRLRLVHVVHVPVMAGLGWKVDASMEAGRLLHAMKAANEDLARRRRHWVLEHHPGLDLESEVVVGDPRETLEHQARSASLLVVGSRGHGRVQSLVLGSVSAYVARHSTCPAVVFREPGASAYGVLVVVHAGDDPSAFGFAAPYAALHRVPLTVLRESGTARTRERAIEAWRRLDEEIAAFRDRQPGSEIRFQESERVDVEQVVASASEHELIVVERHPHARPVFEPAVAVAEHSSCPVAVVPGLTAGSRPGPQQDLSASEA